ncbi:HlyD family efflux transporter periplasmic adaptor subunit [Brevibacillus fulvus]|uniref:Multidrug resistance efflux pump n=1 Tax=Brevibacillus fulvus TaxID=1125967 RepID=A0A939BVQ2_9BACL|nr:HlyD family efflux transporter periplasmic adaptor subunit [Brevibacillus fulvus]MBM7591679.1 multidrug resistance efflux pump [Brevibacillus fulvus]
MKKKFILYLIILLIVVAGGGIGYWYWYQSEHYVTSEDARLSADIYRVMPRITAKLTSLQIKEGDSVVADQVVGLQDTANLSNNLLDNAALRAPITGTVIKTLAKEGEVVTTGQAVAQIIDESKLYVSANIEETDIGKVKLGQKVEFTIDAFPGKTFTGKVFEIGEATNSTFSLLPATNTSGNFTKVTQRIPIKISIDDMQGLKLSAGLNTYIKIFVK